MFLMKLLRGGFARINLEIDVLDIEEWYSKS